MKFEIIRPTKEYAEKVMAMRFDEEARKNSLTFRDPLTLDQFYPLFLEKYFTIRHLPSLFVWEGDQRVATLRFNLAEKGVEISIVLDPLFRGKGLGKKVLSEIKPWLKAQGVETVLATIKKSNNPSIKIFSRNGFVKMGEKGDDLFYHLKLNNPKKSTFIIAEAGSNWKTGTDDWERVVTMIQGAAAAEVDAIKFQVFKAGSIYAENAGVADYLGEDINTLFKSLELPVEWLPKIAELCRKEGIEFMASPFSVDDFNLIDLYVKRHKIASYENHHVRLLDAVAHSKKPVYVSTGTSRYEDILWAVNYLRKRQSGDITLLQCTAKYPAPPSEMNLEAIRTFKESFGVESGLSDHSADPFIAPLMAIALGATAIEKHFTLDRALKGPDHKFAITLEELKALVRKIREGEKMLGCGFKKIEESENELFHFARRSLQTIKPISKGEIFKEGHNFSILRPGKNKAGADPKDIDKIEGTKALRDYQVGEGIP